MSTKTGKSVENGRMGIEFYDDKDQFGNPRIPFRGHYEREYCDRRRAWAEKFANCSLEQCGQWWHNEGTDDSSSCKKLKGNIENPIGLVKIPLAICGPLLIKGRNVDGFCLCPLATTEGALVASVTRGATALSRSGGVRARVLNHAQIRSPYFIFRTMDEVEIFLKWLQNKLTTAQQKVTKISQHANLTKIESTQFGRAVIIHFSYETGDACGQNMVTSCTHDLCTWLLEALKTELPQVKLCQYFIETGMSGDKKIGFLNQWRTRGHHVQAEAWIPTYILKSILKVDITVLLHMYNVFQTGHLSSGFTGCNVNVSNLIAGVFMATGQDVAAVESCHAQLFFTPLTKEEWIHLGLNLEQDLIGDEIYAGLYASIVIPSLNVGTVGGGVGLATQKECLKLIGCNGKNDVGRLCEVIAAYALCLDLSTMSALATNQFAKAHEKLGKNHPQLGLKHEDLNEELFSTILGEDKKHLEFLPYGVHTGGSILSDITKKEVHKKVGHFGYKLKYSKNGKEESIEIVIKSKTTALETCNMLSKIASVCGLEVATEYEKYKLNTEFRDCDIREVLVYEMTELQPYFPKIYYTCLEPMKEVFLIAMEFLSDAKFSHLDTVNNITVWNNHDIKIVLQDLASLHSIYFARTEKLVQKLGCLEKNTGKKKLESLWVALLDHAKFEFPRVWTSKRAADTLQMIRRIDAIDSLLNEAPHTLIHNDCNPRNMCLRKNYTSSPQLCLYDWELATIDTPQRDLVEFLSFVFDPSQNIKTWMEAIQFYLKCLEEYTGYEYSFKKFLKVFNCAAWEYTIRRLLMYTMAHTLKDYAYLPRVVSSMFTYLNYISETNAMPFNQYSKL